MNSDTKVIALILSIILIFILLLGFFATMLVSVGVGHAVILVDPIANTISEPIIGPRWIVKAPWVGSAVIYYATDAFEDVIPCFSSDQLEMQIQVLIRWSLDPTKIKELYQSYPNLNFKVVAIESIMEETIRLVTKDFSALETIEFRDVVVNAVEQAVLKEIKEEPSLVGALIHLELDMKDIAYPENYTKAIQEKLWEEQMLLKADFERQRIVILADAHGQQIRIEAQAIADAKIIIANGTRDAIEQILTVAGGDSSNVTRIAELYLWVETLKQMSPDIDTFIMAIGDDGIPFIYPIPSTGTD